MAQNVTDATSTSENGGMWRNNSMFCNELINYALRIVEMLFSAFPRINVMHQSIPAVTIPPPPGQPPGICVFFFVELQIPRPRAARNYKFPAPGQQKSNKNYKS